MQNKISPAAAPSHSANDNGPLTSGQVKALKVAIAVMSFLIVAALLAIVGRVIYLATIKKSTPAPIAASSVSSGTLLPQQSLTLPSGAVVKDMRLNGNRLLVHYEVAGSAGAAILDLTTGKALSQIAITPTTP